MTQPKLIREILACYYSFRSTHILIGGIKDDRTPNTVNLKNDRTLIIHTELTFSNTPVSEIASTIIPYKLPVWTNLHDPLRSALGGRVQGELNFEKENEVERANLDDLFYSLQATRRLVKSANVQLTAGSAQLCVKILLKGLMGELCGEVAQLSVEAGEPSEFHHFVEIFNDRFYG